MKCTLLSVVFFLFFSQALFSQAYLKMESFGNSSFRDVDNNRVGNAKGSAMVWQGALSIPVSVKMNEFNRPKAWAVALGGSYTDFRNQHMDRELCPDEILNLNLAFIHLRPINEKWSAMFIAGAGIYTPHTDFSQIYMQNVLGNGGALFIRHLRKNLDIGFGLMVNNSFGYPMIFPGAILEWKVEGKYEVKVQMVNGLEVSAGMDVNKFLKINLLADMNGAMTLEKINNKNMMFTHQYINTAIQPILQLGKGFTLPVAIGVTPYRAAYYKERTLKAFFSDEGEHDPHFAASFYVSCGLRYGF